MIRLEKLSVTFNKGTEQEITALNKIDLSLSEGEFMLVLGANGSGKSTLLNVLAGVQQPGSGQVWVNETNITNWSTHRRAAFIGRVFQQPADGVAADLSVLENFRLASLRNHSRTLRTGTGKAFRDQVASRIEILGMGLENRLNRPIGSFSGGQRQALSLLMATWVKPQLLLLDEPTAALDPKSAETVFNLSCEIIQKQALTALLVTHDLRHCTRAGHRIIQLHEGVIKRNIPGAYQQNIALPEIQGWFGYE